ncbi:hypothetical protein ABZ863_29170 [Saccharomonospora sp. NPDC046836]|uniref:hypothetical protein n=1 Tax=Saccharomonospora sp. NPDC046836 TaxID=3156921 RepID=UPI0033F7D951
MSGHQGFFFFFRKGPNLRGLVALLVLVLLPGFLFLGWVLGFRGGTARFFARWRRVRRRCCLAELGEVREWGGRFRRRAGAVEVVLVDEGVLVVLAGGVAVEGRWALRHARRWERESAGVFAPPFLRLRRDMRAVEPMVLGIA